MVAERWSYTNHRDFHLPPYEGGQHLPACAREIKEQKLVADKRIALF